MIFITGGAHGEETKQFTAIEMIEKDLPKIEKGTVVFIPEMNPSGCQNKTRWVFDDERETNLNNEYHHFEQGQWEEINEITDNKKTGQLAWLMMYYLKQKTTEHVTTVPRAKSMLIDIHREESIPFIRVDRRFTNREDEMEDSQKIAELLNLYRHLGLPIVLEKGENWQEEQFYQSLTATCIRNNILGVTIEEGNTFNPEKENSVFLI